MTHPKNMTIDAYLRQAGFPPHRQVAKKNFIPLDPRSTARFDAVLETVRSNEMTKSSEASGGATISDYLSRRSPSAESALFRFSTIGGNRSTGSVAGRYHFMPLLTASKSIDPSAMAPERTVSPDIHASSTEADTELLIDRSIKSAADTYNLSEALIRSVIRAESNFRPDAVSPAGAQGLMQLMPATAKDLGVTDPFDVQQNIDGGARYIRQMLDRFGGNVKLALAAYNAGPGTVLRYGGDVPPYPETHNYIQRVLAGLSTA